MKGQVYVSDYSQILCCTKCRWFKKPWANAYGLPAPPKKFPLICPDCASRTEIKTGRYKLQDLKKWFGQFTECVGVEILEKPVKQPVDIGFVRELNRYVRFAFDHERAFFEQFRVPLLVTHVAGNTSLEQFYMASERCHVVAQVGIAGPQAESTIRTLDYIDWVDTFDERMKAKANRLLSSQKAPSEDELKVGGTI